MLKITRYLFGLMKGDITSYEKLLSSDGQQNRNKPHLIHYFQQVKKKIYVAVSTQTRVHKTNKNEKTEKQ